jgi:hypothetical protein
MKFDLDGFFDHSSLQISITGEEIGDAIRNAEIPHDPSEHGQVRMFDHIFACVESCVSRARNLIRPSGAQSANILSVILQENFLDRVIMVGGASQFPEVLGLVKQHLPGVVIELQAEINAGTHPLFAIAQGASVTDLEQRSAVMDRPAYSLSIGDSHIYEAYSPTFSYRPNSMYGGTSAREFEVYESIRSEDVVTLTDEFGDEVQRIVAGERYTNPKVTFDRLGRFTISEDYSSSKTTIAIPSRTTWQMEQARRRDAAQAADAQHARETTSFFLDDNPK